MWELTWAEELGVVWAALWAEQSVELLEEVRAEAWVCVMELGRARGMGW